MTRSTSSADGTRRPAQPAGPIRRRYSRRTGLPAVGRRAFSRRQGGRGHQLVHGDSRALSLAGVGSRLPQHRFHALRPDGPASWKECTSRWARRWRSRARAWRKSAGLKRLPTKRRMITNWASASPRGDTAWNWSMAPSRPGAASKACASSSFNACAGPSWLAKPGPWAMWGLSSLRACPGPFWRRFLRPRTFWQWSFVAAYLILRMAAVWTMGVWGLHDDLLKRRWWLVPLWDAFAFVIWLHSLVWSRVRWQGVEYRVAGRRIPVVPRSKKFGSCG